MRNIGVRCSDGATVDPAAARTCSSQGFTVLHDAFFRALRSRATIASMQIGAEVIRKVDDVHSAADRTAGQ